MATKVLDTLDGNAQRAVNFADPSAAQDLATKGYVDSHAGGGGSSAARHTVTATTASLATGAVDTTTTITLAKTHRIISVSTSRPCELRLYASAAIQTADASRDPTTVPTADQAPILQYTTTDTAVHPCNPVPAGASLEATPGTTFPLRVKNNGTTGTITVSLVVEDIE